MQTYGAMGFGAKTYKRPYKPAGRIGSNWHEFIDGKRRRYISYCSDFWREVAQKAKLPSSQWDKLFCQHCLKMFPSHIPWVKFLNWNLKETTPPLWNTPHQPLWSPLWYKILAPLQFLQMFLLLCQNLLIQQKKNVFH